MSQKGCDATTAFPGHPDRLGYFAGCNCRSCHIDYSTGSTGSGSGSTAATAEHTEKNHKRTSTLVKSDQKSNMFQI